MKSELFSAKIPTLISEILRSGGAGKKKGSGKRNSRPALAFTSARFAGAPPILFFTLSKIFAIIVID